MVLLNKNLLKQQEIDPETEMGIQATHTMLELILDNPNLVGIDSVSDVVRGLEFALQKLWNFPQDEDFHRYQFMIKGCKCPKIDNEDMFRFGLPYRYYNMECPIHTMMNKPEAPEAEETKLLHKHELNEDLVSENEEIEFIKTFLKMFPK